RALHVEGPRPDPGVAHDDALDRVPGVEAPAVREGLTEGEGGEDVPLVHAPVWGGDLEVQVVHERRVRVREGRVVAVRHQDPEGRRVRVHADLVIDGLTRDQAGGLIDD